jgi:hypothetical protein
MPVVQDVARDVRNQNPASWHPRVIRDALKVTGCLLPAAKVVASLTRRISVASSRVFGAMTARPTAATPRVNAV